MNLPDAVYGVLQHTLGQTPAQISRQIPDSDIYTVQRALGDLIEANRCYFEWKDGFKVYFKVEKSSDNLA